LGCGLDGRGFESRQGLGIFLFTTESTLVVVVVVVVVVP
jgi:hypothetical protein